MAFKVIPNPTFVHEARIHVPGEGAKPLKLVFKHKDRDQAVEYFRRAGESEESAATVLLEVVEGWREVDTPFSAEAFEQLLASYPYAARAIFEAYDEGLSGARRGN